MIKNIRNKFLYQNWLYQAFSKIPPFGKLILILVALFLIIPLRLLYEMSSSWLPSLILNFVLALYLWILANVIFYSIMTSYVIQGGDKKKKCICSMVSWISMVALIIFTVAITSLSALYPEYSANRLLKSRTSANAAYTVQIYGARKNPFSGYYGTAYLLDNNTHSKEYVCDLYDAWYIYIKWNSETVFRINADDYEIVEGKAVLLDN